VVRLTRRRLLAAAATGVAAAAGVPAGIALYTSGDDEPLRPATPRETPTTEPVASPTATLQPGPSRGGTAHRQSPRSFSFDTFDALRTGEASVVEVLGRTHSRLIQWSDFGQDRLSGDLAASWEQPDPETWVLHLAPAAKWQELPPLNGRTVTATDVVAHLSRAVELASADRLPIAQRSHDYLRIASVRSPGPGLVTIRTAGPDPFLPLTLAGRFALVQAPEAVEVLELAQAPEPSQVVGSGPFRFEGISDGGSLRFGPHTAGHRQPLLDALDVFPPGGAVDRFRAGTLDEVITRDRRDAVSLRSDDPRKWTEVTRFEDSPIISTVFVGAPPWNNPLLRRALDFALNRQWLSKTLLGGRAVPSSAVPPVYERFAPPPELVRFFPGHGPSEAADGEAEEGRRLWESAGGPGLGPVTVDFPSIFDPLYSASSVVVPRLNAALGAGQFHAAVETYTTISAKALDHRYGAGNAALWFGWGPPFAEPDPSRFLIENYASNSPGPTATGFASAAVDALLARLSAEFDMTQRAVLTRETARALVDADGGGVFDWLVQRSEVFRRVGFYGPLPTPFWDEHLDAETWFGPAAAHDRSP
jgi:peptide/nickel transport system substrate-binding protein